MFKKTIRKLLCNLLMLVLLSGSLTAMATETTSPLAFMNDAKAAALKAASLAPETEVFFTKLTHEHDDGQWVYNVEFVFEGTEYEFELEVDTLRVLESSKETIDAELTLALTKKLLTIDQAAEAAIAYANLTASQVTFSEIQLDADDGRCEYELEFLSEDGYYHELEMDAVSGEVLSRKSETQR